MLSSMPSEFKVCVRVGHATATKEKIVRTLVRVWVLAAMVICSVPVRAYPDNASRRRYEPEALYPWAANTHPTDVAKSHVEEITRGTQKYTVVQGGTMDGRNCRSPMGCGIAREGALLQTWESNRSVRMENVGDTDVVNPWLSNGRNHFRSVEEIVASAVTSDMSDSRRFNTATIPGATTASWATP
jgi:hypothetical protein